LGSFKPPSPLGLSVTLKWGGGPIVSCSTTANVSGPSHIGGLAGDNYFTVSDCYATEPISGSDNVGGLAGGNWSSIITCYATGAVTGNSYVGGLVGENSYADISDCYSAGQVVGSSNVGGLVGYSDNGTTDASFWDVNTSGQTTSAGGTGKTTAEM
jgi:hypothetical protein